MSSTRPDGVEVFDLDHQHKLQVGRSEKKSAWNVTNTLLSVSDDASDSSTHTHLIRQLWQPFWLRRPVLLAFFCLYAIFLAVTLVVYYVSLKHDGLPVSESVSHYAWTYGPTAVLVIAVSLWRQVDYHCKQLAPWSQMSAKPAPARLSILMDYLSPLQIVSFAQAVKYRQYSVIATIIGFVLLKLVTIASTGLLIIGTSVVTESNYPLLITTKFDDSTFDPVAPWVSYSADALYATYANIMLDLPFSQGVSNGSVYPNFMPIDNRLVNATLTAEAEVFQPGYTCTVVDSKVGTPDDESPTLSIILADGQVCQNWAAYSIAWPNTTYNLLPPQVIQADTQWASCNGTDPNDAIISQGLRVYLALDVRYHQTPVVDQSTGLTIYPNSTWNITKLSTVACVASPLLVRAKITNDTSTPRSEKLSFSNSETRSPPARFNGTQMINTVLILLTQFSKFMNATDYGAENTLLRLIALSQDPTSTDYGPLVDAEALRVGTELVMNGVAAQWAQLNLFGQAHDGTTGDATYIVKRLHVAQAPVWIMVSGFALLMLVTIIVWLSTGRRVVSRDPASVGAAAVILSRSGRLNDLLSYVCAGSDASLKEGLSAQHFSTKTTEKNGVATFHIETSSERSTSDRPILKEAPVSTGPRWRPISLSLPVIVLTFILPLIVIAILEILQTFSDRHDGILAVAEGSEKYGRYVPVLVMLAMATLFNAFDFNIATLSVYSQLYRGASSGDASICTNLLGKTAPHALLSAIWGGHMGAVMSTVASLTGSVLTIVVSGLYVIQDAHLSATSQHLERLGTFNLTWNNSVSNDNHAALFLSLVDNLNLPYPNFTQSEIALPEFTLGGFVDSLSPASVVPGSSFATLPALRANLNCTVVQKSKMNVWSATAEFLGDSPSRAAQTNATVDLPNECRQDIIQFDPAWLTFNNSFQFPTADIMYAGALINLDYGPGFANVTWPETYNAHPDSVEIGDNPPSCPSLAFTFGRFEWNSTDTSDVTAMYCFQEMQQVQALITLLPNSTQIDSTQPPVVDESSVKTLPNGDSGSTAFQYRIQNNLANVLVAPNKLQLDGFFNTLVNGTNGPTPESLIGVGNEQKLFREINHLYRRYMAQAINVNMRVACTNLTGSCNNIVGSSGTDIKRQSNTNDDGFGILTVSTTTRRLRQDRTSKVTLQVMLAVMTACGMAAFLLTKMRHVLPYNPCSIAGTMALLAGSNLYSNQIDPVENDSSADGPILFQNALNTQHQTSFIPPGAEWMNDRDLRIVFAGHKYSLGWWRTSNEDSSYDSIRAGAEVATSAHPYERYGIDVGARPTGQNGVSRKAAPRLRNNKSWNMPGLRWRRGYHHPVPSAHIEDSHRNQP